jgi:hypothetical protein
MIPSAIQGRQSSRYTHPGEIVSVPKQDGRSHRVVLKLVVSLGQSRVGLWIDAIMNVGSIDANQDDLTTTLDRDCGVRAKRDVSHWRTVGTGLTWDAVTSVLGTGHARPPEHRQKTCQGATRPQQGASIKQAGDVHD